MNRYYVGRCRRSICVCSRKAKVEVAVQVAQRWIVARLRDETFFSLDRLNARIRELLADLNARPMKGYGGASRRDLFTCFDQPALRPLPAERFVYSLTAHRAETGTR
jgi:hypothetical protein